MKFFKSKQFKIIAISIASVLLAAAIALAGVGIYFRFKKDKKETNPEVVVNPLDFSIDAWDGTTINGNDFISEFAGRGDNTITIDSASSFVHFINEVNDGETFKDTKIYLNKSIDLQGFTINSIKNFKGTFDGGFYTIYNANINGNGLFEETEEAEIKNVGLYNVTINAQEEISGGLIGKAKNTNISNTFVKGQINGNKIGGLVGEYISSNGEYKIDNSFVDAGLNGKDVAGLVYSISTNNSGETAIEKCYYTNGNVSVKTKDGEVEETNVLGIENLINIKTPVWSYNNLYNKDCSWCDYSYRKNSQKLNFNYPIQSGFAKVFLDGSYYEMVVISNGVSNNALDFEQALYGFENNSTIEINIIVNKVFVDARIEIPTNSFVNIKNIKNTQIIRDESFNSNDNKYGLFEVSTSSTLALMGSENCELTLDGNKEYFKNNNLKSSSLIRASEAEIEIYNNVNFVNNINNVEDGEGGAIYLNNSNLTIVENVKFLENNAQIGGAIYCSGNRSGVGEISFLANENNKTLFKGNFAAEYGGALVFNSLIAPSVQNAIFENNLAPTNYDGAIYGESIEIINCDFSKQNVAVTNYGTLTIGSGNDFCDYSSKQIQLEIIGGKSGTLDVDCELQETINVFKSGIMCYGDEGEGSPYIISQTDFDLGQLEKINIVNMSKNCVVSYNDIVSNKGVVIKTVEKPMLEGGTFYYDGTIKSVTLVGFDSSIMSVSGFEATAVGSYTAKVSIKGDVYYKWADEKFAPKSEQTVLELDWEIIKEKYKIVWKNGEEILKIDYVKVGETPAYNGETPTKEADAQYSYEFIGWGDIEVVTEDVEYIAQFISITNKYTISFLVNGNGSVTKLSLDIEYGAVINVKGNMLTIEGVIMYANPDENTLHQTNVFSHWENNGEIITGGVVVTGSMVITAVFDSTSNS